MMCIDYQVFMFCASKVDGVENEESMWKLTYTDIDRHIYG